jgi:hypothetical protein
MMRSSRNLTKNGKEANNEEENKENGYRTLKKGKELEKGKNQGMGDTKCLRK